MKVTGQEGKHSQPKEPGLPQKHSVEHEGYAGACNSARITENNATNANEGRLLEQILNRNNLNQAYARVKANKGAHGVDKMEIGEMPKYLKTNGEAIIEKMPVCRVLSGYAEHSAASEALVLREMIHVVACKLSNCNIKTKLPEF